MFLPLQVSGLPPCILEPGGLLPAGPIVDVLQYSQRDLDAAVKMQADLGSRHELGMDGSECWAWWLC